MTKPDPFAELALDHLAPSPTNPRKTFSDLEDLAASIRAQGVMQPILARPWPDEYTTPEGRTDRPLYEIIAGERRYRAALIAELATIPALVRPLNTRQVLEAQIVENLQRRDVNELEEAEGYQLMMRDHGYTADELAEKVGKSRAYIYGRLKLCALAEAPRQAFLSGKLKASVALLIARIPTPELQAEATEDVIVDEMSAREAAAHVQQEYMLHLDRATWPLDATWPGDITLAHLPACTACPNNTSSNRELYADVAANVCTNAECFRSKRLGYLQAQATELRAAGHQVITGTDARNIAPSGTEYHIHNGWMRLDKKDWLRGEHQTVQAAYGDELDGIPHTWIEDVIAGKLVECIQREQLWGLDRRMNATDPEVNKRIAESNARHQQIAAERAAAKQKNQAENDYRQALVARCRNKYMAMRGNDLLPTEALRAIAHALVSELYDPGKYVQEHLPAGFDLDALDDEAAQAALHERISEYDPAQIVALLLDLTVSDYIPMANYYIPESFQTPRELLSMAEAYGIDPDALQLPPGSETATAPEPTTAPTKAPPGGEDTAPAAPAKTISTPEQAAPAPDSPAPETKSAAKPKKQAAAAASKTKAKTSGRVAAGENEQTPDDPPSKICPATMDMLEASA